MKTTQTVKVKLEGPPGSGKSLSKRRLMKLMTTKHFPALSVRDTGENEFEFTWFPK